MSPTGRGRAAVPTRGRSALGLPLLLLAACNGGGELREPDDAKLRGGTVLLDGFPVPHLTPPDAELGTDLGEVPLFPADGIAGWIDVGVEGLDVYDIEVEPPLQIVTSGDPLFPDPMLGCTPTEPGVYEPELVLTAPDQPDRAYRVLLRCEGTEAMSALTDVALMTDSANWLRTPDALIRSVGDDQVAFPELAAVPLDTRSAQGDTLVAASAGTAYFVRGDDVTQVPVPADVVFQARAGDALVYTDYGAMKRITADGTVTELGQGAVMWASQDGDTALSVRGTAPVTIELVDVGTGERTEVLDADGDPPLYHQAYDLGMSEDLRYLYVGLTAFDLDGGEPFDMQAVILDDLLARGSVDRRLTLDVWNIHSYSLSADGTRIAVGVQVLDAGAGMLPAASGAWVFDVQERRGWFVTPDLRRYSPTAEHTYDVRLSSDGRTALLGAGSVGLVPGASTTIIEETHWREVTP